MTTPREEQPRPAEVPVPSVTTAPARSRWRGSWLPRHLGRARTSTVVLALLWLAFFTLYVFVRPASPATQPTGDTTPQQVVPAPATTRPAPTTELRTTAAPTPPEATTTPPAPRSPASSSPSGTAPSAPTTAGTTTSAVPPASATEQLPVPTPGPTSAAPST